MTTSATGQGSDDSTDPHATEHGRVVWFNCCAGVAGDMLLASLIDAGADRLVVMDAWAALGVGGFAATWERTQRCGVGSLWTNIAIDDHMSAHGDHTPDHGDHGDHGDHPAHRPARDVLELIGGADLPERVRRDALAVYRRLADVEGAIHGVSPDDVELHEVGALDSILDVVGVCAALASLRIASITYSPIAVGHGTVRTAHGTLPNPVPAVARLLAEAGASTVGVDTTMELSTPTGVALLTVLGTCSPMPSMTVEATGFGAGTADPPGRPNVVQSIVGERHDVVDRDDTGRPCRVLEANVDDVTGEVLAYTITRLIDAGAHDAWVTPIIMKKGRPAFIISALCDDATFRDVRAVLVAESGTLGVRTSDVRRWPQQRTDATVELEGHEIRVKVADGRAKAEHDDAVIAARALGLPLRTVIARAERLAVPDGHVRSDAT
ncbi:MAG: nickel pincer cofactor biosynthesis protein LarC [Ilumatobacteraceae bacterium]